MSKKKLSVVIPCFNEEGNIFELHKRVTQTSKKSFSSAYEIIFINDGSIDSTWNIIKQLAKEDKHVVGINLSRNHGHQIALSAGLSFVSGDVILIMDADLQDPPELLPNMLKIYNQGCDVVFGVRRKREGETLFKKVSAYLFYRFINSFSDSMIPKDTGDFRLVSRRVVDLLIAMPEQYRFIRGMVAWTGFKQLPVYYDRGKRFAGETHYPFRKMVQFALDAVTGFSIKPLRIASYLGFLMFFISIFFFLYIILNYINGTPVKGWSSIICSLLFLNGVQLLMIGLIGEYIGRVYVQSKNRPLFVISEVIKKKIL
jgi:glycosyltransferase involved in cell wall biosynthesis